MKTWEFYSYVTGLSKYLVQNSVSENCFYAISRQKASCLKIL